MAHRLRGHSFQATPTRHQPSAPPRTSADSARVPSGRPHRPLEGKRTTSRWHRRQRLASSYARRPPPHHRLDPLPPDPPEGCADLAGADLSLPYPGEDGADLARGTSQAPTAPRSPAGCGEGEKRESHHRRCCGRPASLEQRCGRGGERRVRRRRCVAARVALGGGDAGVFCSMIGRVAAPYSKGPCVFTSY